MITKEKLPERFGGRDVEVEWEIGEEMDDAGDGHVFMHAATGYTTDPNDQEYEFQGTAIKCDGEFTEINEVEFIGKTEIIISVTYQNISK
jgi:hypothetical protein